MFLKYKDIHAFDNYKTMKIITVCTEQVRSPYIEHAASGLSNPTRLEGGGTIYPGSRPAGVTTRSPRMVTECLLTRSKSIKMYLPLHGMCLYMYFVFTVSQFHAVAHSVYLVKLHICFCVTQQFYQKA